MIVHFVENCHKCIEKQSFFLFSFKSFEFINIFRKKRNETQDFGLDSNSGYWEPKMFDMIDGFNGSNFDNVTDASLLIDCYPICRWQES